MKKKDKIDFDKLHWDVRKKVKNDGCTLAGAASEMDLSPMVFRNIYTWADIKSSTLAKVLVWLDRDLKEYLI